MTDKINCINTFDVVDYLQALQSHIYHKSIIYIINIKILTRYNGNLLAEVNKVRNK